MSKNVKFTTNYVRQSWLDIFQQKGYYLLEPSSLIPQNDLSLLWINSGVATLKKYFNNPSLAPARNLVNCQRVIRTDDIANINAQSYHQTLFEMLGNFSIGSNFKPEIIPIVWEWFTSPKWLNMNPQHLFITVWENDKVSYEIWQKQKGVKGNHILFGNKKTNFWDMGDGPCGPNTEIYYDFQTGQELPKKITDLDNKRFLEISNTVFPEFYHKGTDYLPLAEKCVDNGTGLERIAMVLQSKKNTFEIDLWEPIIKLINDYHKEDLKKFKGDYYVMADHLRTTIFALADGAVFEPKGRGYILKKLVKKATLLTHFLNLNGENLQKIIELLIKVNCSYYSHLREKKELIISELKKEIDKNFNFVDKSVEKLNSYYSPGITAEDIFFWYDTKGISLELIRFYLEEKKHNFPEKAFNNLLEKQKERSLKDRKKKNLSVF